MRPDFIRRELIERGTPLNDGVSAGPSFDRMKISEEMMSIHRQFDGFSNMDTGSYIQMWSLGMIETGGGYDFEGRLTQHMNVVGDILIGSEFIICSLTHPDQPLRLLTENRILSASYFAFWDDLLAGRLDR